MGNPAYFLLIIFGFIVSFEVDMIGGTDCYVCYSWRDQGCEEDYMYNVNLTTCGAPPTSPYWRGDRDREREERDRLLNAPPTTCIKDVIVFINPSVRSQNDRYNRFNRPWVERKCGVPIHAGYRSGSDYIDDCVETEVTIEGVAGIKRSCSCSTDGCNAAVSMKSGGALVLIFVGVFAIAPFSSVF